jgi:Na+-driven multidrug efflux pump
VRTVFVRTFPIVLAFVIFYDLLSNTRSFALRALGFSSISFPVGMIGFFVITLPLLFLPHTQTGKSGGQVHGFCSR